MEKATGKNRKALELERIHRDRAEREGKGKKPVSKVVRDYINSGKLW